MEQHEALADRIIKQFNLTNCAEVLCVKCSGGQRRRLSIGLELINAPRFLLLDEPTSGLDSNSALQCVQLMKELAEKQNLAIIVSLHQPSTRILTLFHRLYILSHDGRLLFNDNLDKLRETLANLNVPCPPLYNIADHAIEVASGDFGAMAVDSLAELASAATGMPRNYSETASNNMIIEANNDEVHSNQHNLANLEQSQEISETNSQQSRKTGDHAKDRITVQEIANRMQKSNQNRFFYHIYLLTLRCLLVTLREPWLNVVRLAGHVGVAIIVSILYNRQVGAANGCVLALEGNFICDWRLAGQ